MNLDSFRTLGRSGLRVSPVAPPAAVALAWVRQQPEVTSRTIRTGQSR
jgi:hypothetical protein